jgi:hypothetical protein
MSRTVVSDQLRIAAKLNRRPFYELAKESGINPGSGYKIIRGIDSVQENDPRIIRLGELLGVPASKCFAVEELGLV